MVVTDGQQVGEEAGVGTLAAFSAAALRLAESENLADALGAVAEAAFASTQASVAVVRTVDPVGGELVARAVAADSSALAAELEGSRIPLRDLPLAETTDRGAVPAALRRIAERIHAEGVILVPVVAGGRPLGSVELVRGRGPFGSGDLGAARLAAAQTALAVRAFAEGEGRSSAHGGAAAALDLAGDALAAGYERAGTAEEIARLAAEATGARSCVVWRARDDGALAPVASFGFPAEPGASAEQAVQRALGDQRPVLVEAESDASEGGLVATLRLGRPPLGVLQLFFPSGAAPEEEALDRLATFGVRAAHALRSAERAGELELELERTRALLAIVGQAIARLSLSHTLETVVDRVAEVLGVERVAVYLSDDGRLRTAAERGLDRPHAGVAEELLELALGPFRARGVLVLEDATDLLSPAGAEARARSGIEAAVAVPLLVREELVGLLAAYPARGRRMGAHEEALLSALAGQLAVAVQNARLHEETKLLGAELEQVLAAERRAARRLRSLYEISRPLVEELSFEKTLGALARTAVELLDVDAAVVRMRDARAEQLEARAVHVASPRLEAALAPILNRAQPIAAARGAELHRADEPLVVDRSNASVLGAPYELLLPFLEQGSTAAVLPVRRQAELLATVTVVSLDPARPIGEETLDLGRSFAAQAALVVDNARLYQQQRDFSETMQQALLPRTRPDVPGADIGAVYASSAHVEVGGDVYDFMTLDGGVLAVVLGDVTGHGVAATADMAMTKFVFRSLAREHPRPGDFLAHANDVVVGEVGAEQFVTLLSVTLDPASGELLCASAGHPAPRVVRADGAVEPLETRGLALGVAPGQRYDEVRTTLEPGDAAVLYTDGVVEARRRPDGAQYGLERLDRVLAGTTAATAEEVAAAAIADCREFADGELVDDCAIVVVKRTEG